MPPRYKTRAYGRKNNKYEHRGILDDMKRTENDFKNVFVGHWDDVLFYTFDDRYCDFDLCGAFKTVLDKIESSDKKISATWVGFVGRDLVVVVALK